MSNNNGVRRDRANVGRTRLSKRLRKDRPSYGETDANQNLYTLPAASSFHHSDHEVDPFRGRMFYLPHPLFETECHRRFEYRPYAIHELSSSTFLWDDQSMNTFIALVAHELYNSRGWRDESTYSFVYPSIVPDTLYFDSAKWRDGSLHADVQLDTRLLTAGCGGQRGDVMFVLSTGKREFGHFSLVRVQVRDRLIDVYDPYNGADSRWLISCCASFVEKAYEELSPTITEKTLRSRKARDWYLRKHRLIHSDDTSDKCACGPLCLEKLVDLVVPICATVGRHYDFDINPHDVDYRCVRRRCLRFMVNALKEHEENVVGRDHVIWDGGNNRPGLRDITLSVYSRSPVQFARYFYDKGGSSMTIYRNCYCMNVINQTAPFAWCMSCDSAFHMHCFLNFVLTKGYQPMRCMWCNESGSDTIRDRYPMLNCNIPFVCIPPFSDSFFNRYRQPGETYNLLYWPQEASSAVEGNQLVSIEIREAAVLEWMKHTYFYEAYVRGGECQFDSSYTKHSYTESSVLWGLGSWTRNPPMWYRSRASIPLELDVSQEDGNEVEHSDSHERNTRGVGEDNVCAPVRDELVHSESSVCSDLVVPRSRIRTSVPLLPGAGMSDDQVENQLRLQREEELHRQNTLLPSTLNNSAEGVPLEVRCVNANVNSQQDDTNGNSEGCITSEEGTAAFRLISLNGRSIRDEGIQQPINIQPPNNINNPSQPTIEDPTTNDANDDQQNNPICSDFRPSTHLQDDHPPIDESELPRRMPPSETFPADGNTADHDNTDGPPHDENVVPTSRGSPLHLTVAEPNDDEVSDEVMDGTLNGVQDNEDTAMQRSDMGYLTIPDRKGNCTYTLQALDLQIQVRRMHFDVSAGYTKAVCDCFRWHIDRRIPENDHKRGILFIVPTELTKRTLDHFARLFIFNKTGVNENGQPMTFYKCSIGGDACGDFACNAERLWHMELSVMMNSCEKARRVPVTKAYPYNCAPGYVIDEEVLDVFRRTWPRRRRRYDLIRGDKPPSRFEQRAGLSFRRAWHHPPNSAFYQFTHSNAYQSNHREGELEYRRMPVCGLDIFQEKENYFSKKGRIPPLLSEYPHVYKLPFILPYDEWGSQAKRHLMARLTPIQISHNTDEADSDSSSSGEDILRQRITIVPETGAVQDTDGEGSATAIVNETITRVETQRVERVQQIGNDREMRQGRGQRSGQGRGRRQRRSRTIAP